MQIVRFTFLEVGVGLAAHSTQKAWLDYYYYCFKSLAGIWSLGDTPTEEAHRVATDWGDKKAVSWWMHCTVWECGKLLGCLSLSPGLEIVVGRRKDHNLMLEMKDFSCFFFFINTLSNTAQLPWQGQLVLSTAGTIKLHCYLVSCRHLKGRYQA